MEMTINAIRLVNVTYTTAEQKKQQINMEKRSNYKKTMTRKQQTSLFSSMICGFSCYIYCVI